MSGRAMTQLKRPDTLTATVAKHIRDAIIRGEFEPGSPLPEVRLADQLGTSRGTVREALRTLEDQGLVDVLPHRGSFVSTVTRRKAAELYSLRAVLESFAVRLSVEARAFDGEAGATLQNRLSALRTAIDGGDTGDMIEAERALHREIASHCGHDLLLEQVANIGIQTRRLLHYMAFDSRSPNEFEAHRRLVDAVLSGDPDRAEREARDHILRSAEAVMARMPPEPIKPAP